MIVQPKIRGFICTTAHPVGCAQLIKNKIDYVKSKGKIENGPKNVLVIGASTGYGFSSRIVSAFGCGAATIGVFFEKPAEGKRTATAGWYNSVAFEKEAQKDGLYAKSFNGDGFSDEIRDKVAETIKKDLGQVDLIIYSLASPRRQHPKTGKIAKSVLKPIGKSYTNTSIDLKTNKLETVSLPEATQEEIDQTVSVMGGEDWEYWINRLEADNLLADGCTTVAYSYVGPKLTKPVYRQGTIGRAKDHLEQTAQKLNKRFSKIKGRALISVNKALVTQSSSAIPFIPLYFIILSKVMKDKNVHENCIEQVDRLFRSKLYCEDPILVNDDGFIRMDNHEMNDDVQKIVHQNWDNLNQENLEGVADLKGYHKDFLNLFGFGVEGVDYDADVEIDLNLPSAP